MRGRQDGKDRRLFGRRLVTIHGEVHIPGRPTTVCIIRDLSVGGARLEFHSRPWLPYSFRLTAPGAGLDVVCEVRHDRMSGVGVEFVEPAQDAPKPLAKTLDLDAMRQKLRVQRSFWN